MTTTVVGLFDDLDHARMAVQDLRELGITNADIGFATHDARGEYGRSLEAAGSGAATGAAAGALLGGIGGLLVGLGALVIPGIGPIVAAGPLAAALGTLAGAGVGAVTGGVVGSLVDLGVPEEEAQYYVEGVRRGGTLVTVKAPDRQVDQVRQVLGDHHAVNVRERATTWRESGWAGYQPDARPYTVEEVMAERRRYAPTAFSTYEPGFRGHYQTTFARSGYQYEHYRPAYEYGWQLREDDRYRTWDWERLEPEARRGWEERHPGTTWEDIKGAVRYAWQSFTDELRDIRAGRE
jgi:hypothetical protein